LYPKDSHHIDTDAYVCTRLARHLKGVFNVIYNILNIPTIS